MNKELNHQEKIDYLLKFIDKKIKTVKDNKNWLDWKNMVLSYKSNCETEDEFEVIDKIFYSSVKFTEGFKSFLKKELRKCARI